jgi:UDPglucose 6-dehydrogenase
MKVGVVGLGKVGLPLALVLQQHGGHDVVGYDLDRERVLARLDDPQDHGEAGLGNLIAGHGLTLVSLEALVAHAEVVFAAVQTLHGPGYGGETPMPAEPADFQYEFLVRAVSDLSWAADQQGKDLTIAVVSTVLPGTLRQLRRHMPPDDRVRVRLVYNPALISLGSVVSDLLQPDFCLIGSDDPQAASRVVSVWDAEAFPPRFHLTSIESAELLKVALNAYLSSKIVFANTLAELCQAIPRADVDDVTTGLALSGKAMGPYGLTAGMGDGGPCRPRDLIALSWLTLQSGLPTDPFHFATRAREAHTHRLARLAADEAKDRNLTVRVLGMTYKPGSRIIDGSPAGLLYHYLGEIGGVWTSMWDPVFAPEQWPTWPPT